MPVTAKSLKCQLAGLSPDDTVRTNGEVFRVSKWLRGRSVVLIGGECRNRHQKAIEDQLSLKELIWIPTKHGTSVKSLVPHVARPDVAVVLLAIRWASHECGNVHGYCKLYQKPLVRLPGGYSPGQIAHQIASQSGRRLQLSSKTCLPS